MKMCISKITAIIFVSIVSASIIQAEMTIPITNTSGPERFAVHGYYCVSSESPNGRYVSYFQYAGAAPGAGRVVVANQMDGTRTYRSEMIYGNSHTGVFPRWIENEKLAYRFQKWKTHSRLW